MVREPRSTVTFTRGLSYNLSLVRREKLRHGNQPERTTVAQNLTFCLFPHKQLSTYWCQPLCWPSRFLHFLSSMDYIAPAYWHRVWKGHSCSFSTKIPHPPIFSSLSRIPLLFPKTTVSNHNRKKKNRASVWFTFATAQAYDFLNSQHTG